MPLRKRKELHQRSNHCPRLTSSQASSKVFTVTCSLEMADAFTWLDFESLTLILRKKFPELKQNNVQSYELIPDSQIGRNFASHITKIIIHINSERRGLPRCIKLFTKTVVDRPWGQLLKKTGVLEKEALMYAAVLPLMNDYLPPDDSLSPFAFPSPRVETIILEDLTEIGYRSISKTKQLNFHQTVCTLKKLAKFHAASVAVSQKAPYLIREVGKEISYSECNKSTFFSTFIEKILESIRVRLENMPEVKNHRQFAKIIGSLKGTLWRSMGDARNSNEYRIQVLNHGDLWLPNIMYKTDEAETVENLKFVDFQFCFLSSPVIDIHSFLLSNVQFHVLDENLETFLAEYLDELNLKLRQFDTGKFVHFEDFYEDYEKSKILSVFAGLIQTIPILADPIGRNDTNATSNQNTPTSSFFEVCMNSESYRSALPKILNYLEKKGILNLP